jgi:type IV pilus assembly protein PilY1
MKQLQKHLLRSLFWLALLAAGPALGAGVDLVGDDTDLFTTNPSIPAEVPNVLIVLDNTSNWSQQAQHWPSTMDPACVTAGMSGNQQGDAEVCAIFLTIQSLTQSVNVGLMMFNDQDKGAYVRFPMSSMTSANIASFKTALVGISTNTPADKTSSNTHYTGPMNDVFRYFNSLATYQSNATPTPQANVSGYTDSTKNAFQFIAGQNGDTCGYDYVVFIGNGFPSKDTTWVANPAAGGAADLVAAAALLNDSANVTFGTNNSQLVPLQNTGSDADVWAKFLFNYGVKVGTGAYRHVTTYTIDACNSLCDPDQATLLKSMASVSQGKYFQVTTLSAIQTALSQIFAEVQAVNSVFAATTLPVSINVRGTNLNQVYIGVFRPDATSSPRWLGNLKQYQLGVNTSTGALQLVDASGTAAVNLNTGFISNSATSFWTSTYNAYGTTPSTGFWAFRSPNYATTDVGKDQDSPDGDLVEKGGAAERVRIAYPLPDSTTAQTRNIYTCTGTCAAGSSLSSFPFNDANTNITAATLGTFQTLSVTSLSASGTTATGVTSSAHGFSTGDVVTISGASPNLYNGNFAIVSVPTTTSFTYTLSSAPVTNVAYATYTTTNGPTNALNLSNNTSDKVTVASATPTDYNVTAAQASSVSGAVNQFSYPLASSTSTPASGFAVTAVRKLTSLVWSGGIVTGTTPTAHGYSAGDSITISGATDSVFNGTFTLTSVPSTTTFKFNQASTPTNPAPNTTTGIVTLSAAVPASWGTGPSLLVCGVTPSAYNTAASSCTAGNLSATMSTATICTSAALCPGVTPNPSTAALGTYFTYTTNATVTSAATSVASATIQRLATNDTSTWTVSAGTVNSASTSSATLSFTLSNVQYSVQTVRKLAVNDQITITNCSYQFTTGSGKNATTTSQSCAGGPYTITAITTGADTSALTNTALAANTYGTMTSNSITITIAPPGVTPTNQTVIGAPTVSTTTAGGTPGTNATTIAWTGSTLSSSLTATSSPAISSIGVGPQSVTATTTGGIFAAKTGDLTSAIATITTQGSATGTISAGLASNPDPQERTHLINWVRGQDNKDDENLHDGSSTTAGITCATTATCDVRASVHGDVLHSRPAVINYNRNSTSTVTDNNDVYVFYGANDGMIHAVRGGQATDGTAGNEQWTFIAPEHFSKLKRLRNQAPTISSVNPKDYFFDGPIGIYTLDANNDGKYTTGDSSGDKVYLFLAMRRGGRMMYALDVTDPTSPKLLWKKGCTNATGTGTTGGCDTGWDQIGQTWSQPQPVYLRAYPTTLALVFAAGYDPSVEDFQSCVVTSYGSTSVSAVTGVSFPNPMSTANCPPSGGSTSTASRSMGRGIFIVNAATGAILKRIGPDSGADLVASGMTYAMPGDIAILKNRTNAAARSPSAGIENVPSGYMDKIYATDTGGNIWRVDVADADPTKWVVNKFASIATASASSTTTGTPAAANMRKFEFQPDVVYTSDANGAYDAVLVGSGDREHPFDQVVNNRFYMFKDRNTATLYALGNVGTNTPATVYDTNAADTTPATGAAIVYPAALTESNLFDITNGCLQDATLCSTGQTQAQAASALLAASGWMMQLANTGEKTIAPATTAAGTVIFNTNQPKQDTVTGTSQNVGANASNACTSDLGTARQYGINFQNGNAANIFNALPTQYVPSAGHNRYALFAGGGFLPQPVPAVVQIGGKYYQTIISGVQATNPGGISLQRRVRTYWYKKVD